MIRSELQYLKNPIKHLTTDTDLDKYPSNNGSEVASPQRSSGIGKGR